MDKIHEVKMGFGHSKDLKKRLPSATWNVLRRREQQRMDCALAILKRMLESQPIGVLEAPSLLENITATALDAASRLVRQSDDINQREIDRQIARVGAGKPTLGHPGYVHDE